MEALIFPKKTNSIYAIFIICFLFLTSCKTDIVDRNILNKAIMDTGRNSYFIEIYNNNNQAYYIVANERYFYYCKTNYGWSETTYISNVKNSVNSDNVIEICVKDIPDYFHEVNNVLSSTDKDEILSKYCVNFGFWEISEKTPPELEYEIVQRLLHLNVLCKTDSETGFPFIPRYFIND